MKTVVPIILTSAERSTIDSWAKGRSIPYRLVQRARIIRMAVDGALNQDIAKKLQISRPTVQLWRQRFLSLRLPGLEKDAPRPGRKHRIAQRKINSIIEATIQKTSPDATHWSTRSMSKAQGVSKATVCRIWKQHNLKPHVVETFKLSQDKQFVEKLQDVVGLYLNPPDKALVLCVDKKSQIQALERSQPLLPLRPAHPARQTHDYKRHGTTTLFAALNMLDGKVIGDCMPRHRHQEFIRFLQLVNVKTPPDLDLQLIVDNYGAHKHERVETWLKRHPRFHLHFTPTSISWLNMVERWFREITDKRIRRGSFKSVPDLIATIMQYLENHNQNPHVFIWSASVDAIMTKISKCKEVFETIH